MNKVTLIDFRYSLSIITKMILNDRLSDNDLVLIMNKYMIPYSHQQDNPGLILGFHPANETWRFFVTFSPRIRPVTQQRNWVTPLVTSNKFTHCHVVYLIPLLFRWKWINSYQMYIWFSESQWVKLYSLFIHSQVVPSCYPLITWTRLISWVIVSPSSTTASCSVVGPRCSSSRLTARAIISHWSRNHQTWIYRAQVNG